MKIWKRLRPEHIFLNVPLQDKEGIFHFVVETFAGGVVVEDATMLYDSMMMREKTMSTGIGDGIGIPHATSWEAKDAAVILIRLSEAIDFDALDKLPVDIILSLVIPENQITTHLRILAGLSRLCQNPEFLKAVRQAKKPKDLLEKIKRLEEEMAFH